MTAKGYLSDHGDLLSSNNGREFAVGLSRLGESKVTENARRNVRNPLT
jgi:hypothetical protein